MADISSETRLEEEEGAFSPHMRYDHTDWGWRFGPFRGNRNVVIKGCEGKPLFLRHVYLEIAFGPRMRTSLLKVMRHDWYRSDEDRDLHDHPWPFVTYIARGGYEEELPDPHAPLVPEYLIELYPELLEKVKDTRSVFRQAGSLLFRGPRFRHAVRLLPEDELTPRQIESGFPARVVSYVVVGPRVREWGFWTLAGKKWVDWITYGRSRLCE